MLAGSLRSYTAAVILSVAKKVNVTWNLLHRLVMKRTTLPSPPPSQAARHHHISRSNTTSCLTINRLIINEYIKEKATYVPSTLFSG